MRKLLFLIPIALVLEACSSSTNYNSSKLINTNYFSCDNKQIISNTEKVIIKAKDLKKCYIENNNKIVWLYFYYQNCPTQDINVQIKQKNVFEKYTDKIDYIVISETFDIKEVKKTEQIINHPISFIDPSYSKKRIQNSKDFLKEVLGDSATDEALIHTSVFIYDGKVIGTAYSSDINQEFIERMLLKK